MATGDHPDRAEWPRYWRAIRLAAVWVVTVLVVVGATSFLPRPDSLPTRIAMELIIGVAVVSLATRLARRTEAWRERRSA